MNYFPIYLRLVQIPMDFYANLYKQRTNIILPENKLIQVNTKTAFHPAMTGMANLLQKGKLSVIQNVGYPTQNRAHFSSTDIMDKWFTRTNDYNRLVR